MNKLTLFIVTLLLFASNSFAFEGNPDRYPSLGADLILGSGTGTYTASGFTASGFPYSQDLKSDTSTLVLDGRIPTSDHFTLNLGFALSGSKITGDTSPSISGFEQKSSSFNFDIGIRYYFH